MIAPILRLLAIYLVVGLAVFGFFKRDTLMPMFSGGSEATIETSEPVSTSHVEAPAAAPTSAPVYAPLPDEGDATLQPPVPQAATGSEGDATYATKLSEARSAYWRGDFQAAIASYTTLLAQYPEDEGLNGELGNIYFMNGQNSEAATYYENAAMAALAAGHTDTARALVGVLRSLDQAAASRVIAAGATQ